MRKTSWLGLKYKFFVATNRDADVLTAPRKYLFVVTTNMAENDVVFPFTVSNCGHWFGSLPTGNSTTISSSFKSMSGYKHIEMPHL